MFKKYSMKKQFIFTFVLVIVSSIIAVTATFLIAVIFVSGKDIKSANYYEKLVPSIESYIKENNVKLLDYNGKKGLEELIPSEGIKYKVIALENNIRYGTLESSLTKEELLTKINVTNVNELNVVNKYIPVIKEGEIKGVVVLQYTLAVTSNNIPQWIISLFSIIALVSPFIYIVLFSYLFGLKLSRNINIPLNKIKWASEKIKNRDLDFNLDYPYNNELGMVISSFNEMKEKLKVTLDTQWNMEEERKNIVSGLSHDLRSPLTVIKGKVDLLLEGSHKNEERLKSYLESINKSTNRAIILVEDLNAVNKIENPKFNITKSENNVMDFLDEKIEGIRPLLKEKSIEFNIETIGINKETLWNFDDKAMSRVIDNIILNAVKHTNDFGYIKVKVSVSEERLNFKIDDTGKGFSKEELKKALDRFYRGDDSRGVNSGNLGLGLYISNIIIEKHGGEIKLSNNSSGGASVGFYIA